MDLGEGEKPEEAGRMGGGEKREKERRQRWCEGERKMKKWGENTEAQK